MATTPATTLSAATQVCLVNKPASDTLTQFEVSGSYTGFTYVVEGLATGTTFKPLASVQLDTGNTVPGGTTAATDASSFILNVPSVGLSQVQLRCVAIASNTAIVSGQSFATVGVPTLGTSGGSASASTGQTLAANGAITIKQGVVNITKGTACVATLAAPTPTTDDYKRLLILSTTAAAHTVTNTTPGFNNGGSASDIATFGATISNSFEVEAYQGVWYVANTPAGVTFG